MFYRLNLCKPVVVTIHPFDLAGPHQVGYQELVSNLLGLVGFEIGRMGGVSGFHGLCFLVGFDGQRKGPLPAPMATTTGHRVPAPPSRSAA